MYCMVGHCLNLFVELKLDCTLYIDHFNVLWLGSLKKWFLGHIFYFFQTKITWSESSDCALPKCIKIDYASWIVFEFLIKKAWAIR